MGTFFVYILKASVCLAVFYLFYRLLLSKETFHRFNRIAVLGILLLSLLVPLIEVSFETPHEVQQTGLALEQLLFFASVDQTITSAAEDVTITWVHFLLLAYILGVIFFIGRNIYSLICLLKLIQRGTHKPLKKGCVLVTHNKPGVAPFSWMKFIVISRNDLEENGREILIHEMAHIRNKHSVDLLIADICMFFQWFNPAAWLLKQELQNIHEYEADETVINEGIDAKQYQLLLIKKAVGTRLYSMANSFNHSKLKKRITMMLKEKSSPWARLRYLYVLPVAAIAVTAFARPELSNELKEISAAKVNDLAAIVKTKDTEKELMPADTLFLSNSDFQSDAIGDMTLHIEKGSLVLNKPVTVHRKDSVSLPPNAPIIVVDGERISANIFSAIDPKWIDKMTVIKDEANTSIYGKEAKNGVVLITLKKDVAASMFSYNSDASATKATDITGKLKVTGSVKDKSGKPIVGANVLIKGKLTGTISDLDGNFVLYTDEDDTIEVSFINMSTVSVKAASKVSVVLKE